MQPVSERSVLGDFANANLTHFGVKSTFYRQDGRFMVRTEGADGQLVEYEVKYVFGVHPLQQYLIEFPGGRLQALGLAWDARPGEQGGQRWFHLYPDEKIGHDDELHWTKPSQNWNSMCADCHSTNLEKNYDAGSGTFSTTWSEIDVACEACHGPGSGHVAWAERKPGWEKSEADKGLVLLLDERKDVAWRFEPDSGTAVRSRTRQSDKEIEMCARCHARRSPITLDYRHGERFMDHYMPRLLDEGMYFADGQIDDEVYVYGSLLQSKMYQAGVTCSDCHEPHTLELKAPGNGVCLQCHLGGKYGQPSHHFHKVGSEGASCAECHMPPRTYMVVDPRHDHSMRIPRPDLSVTLGTPNACNRCHQDKTAEWAAGQVKQWYGRTPKGFQDYAATLHAARRQLPDAGKGLAALIRNAQAPDIARASALSMIGPYLDRSTVDVLTKGLADKSPLVRIATITALESTPLSLRVQLVWPMLSDRERAVRIEAARILLPIPSGQLAAEEAALLERGIREYEAAQLAMAERPEAQTSLGNLFAARGDFGKSVSAYQAALSRNPAFVPALVNLADLHRSRSNEEAAEKALRQASKIAPNNPDVHHALGLLLVRQKRMDEAVESLRLATTLDSGNARHLYVYAVALHSTGKAEEAIGILKKAHDRHPNNGEILNALVSYYRKQGDSESARFYARKLNRP